MNINFNKSPDGLVPVIIQDFQTLQVLMLGYMNEEAFLKTKEEKRVCFYSRSKNRLWTKGESSGNFLNVVDIKLDCDADTLLILANPQGPTCHNGTSSCFGNKNEKGFIYQLENIIHQRIESDTDNSYTNKIYKKGINKMAQKLGEEAVELVIEAKDDNIELFKNEAADLMYHFLLLLHAKNTKMSQVEKLLYNRHKEKTA
jgi:phosphoribosyl-ATP pyrophosphohydrolase/phosphoribosyl-AMP cyclohydrolase